VKSGFITITKEFIDQGKTGVGGWKKEQITILGLEWPLRKGWQYEVIGSIISQEEADRFLSLKEYNTGTTTTTTKVTIELTEEQFRVLKQVLGKLLTGN